MDTPIYVDFGDDVWHELVAGEAEPWKGGRPRCRAHPGLQGKRARLPHQLPPGANLCQLCQSGEVVKKTWHRRRPAPGMVPNEPIRAAFEASGLRVSDLARRLEVERSNGQPDVTRVRRMLGLYPGYRAADGSLRKQRHLKAEKAVEVIRALHLDPVDFGL